jgi:hypothetical protein
MSRYKTCVGLPSASARCVSQAFAAVAHEPPLQEAPGLTLSAGFQSFHVPNAKLQLDKATINIRSFVIFAARHVDNSNFLCIHRARLVLSQVEALFRLRPGSGIPSISTVYAQAWHHCAQVIHMFVHRQGSNPLAGGQAAADQPTLRYWHARRPAGLAQLDRLRTARPRLAQTAPIVLLVHAACAAPATS